MFKLAQKKKEEQDKREQEAKHGYSKQMSIRSKLLTQGRYTCHSCHFYIHYFCVFIVCDQRLQNFNQNYQVSVATVIVSISAFHTETCSVSFGDVDDLRMFTLTIKPCEDHHIW